MWQARIRDNKINNKWATTIYVWLIMLVYRAMHEYIPGMLWSDTTRIVSWASRNVHIPDCSGLHAQRRAALAWNKKRHMISRYLRSTICRHTHTHTIHTTRSSSRLSCFARPLHCMECVCRTRRGPTTPATFIKPVTFINLLGWPWSGVSLAADYKRFTTAPVQYPLSTLPTN